MKPYEKSKPSGIDWIGETPEHWNLKKMKYVSAKKKFAIVDGPFGTQLKAEEYINEGIPLIRITNLSYAGKLKTDEMVFISERKAKEIERSRIILGDVIIGKTGATIGKSGLNDQYEYAIIASSCLKISSDLKQLIPGFLKYFICSDNFQTELVETSGGSTRDTINIEPLKNLYCILPSLAEQTTIANFLDKKTIQIGKLISNKQTLIELLNEERTAIINEAVNGKEKNWERKKLKYVAKLKSGDGITADDIKPEGDYAVYGGNGLRGFTSAFTHEGNYILIGRQGALCGNINYANGKFFASEHAVVVSILDRSEFIWLGELLRSMNLNQYSQASAQPGLSVEKIQNLIVPVPPLEEQTVIVKKIKIETERIDNTITKIENEIKLMNEYRTALISEVVTGKIKVV